MILIIGRTIFPSVYVKLDRTSILERAIENNAAPPLTFNNSINFSSGISFEALNTPSITILKESGSSSSSSLNNETSTCISNLPNFSFSFIKGLLHFISNPKLFFVLLEILIISAFISTLCMDEPTKSNSAVILLKSITQPPPLYQYHYHDMNSNQVSNRNTYHFYNS